MRGNLLVRGAQRRELGRRRKVALPTSLCKQSRALRQQRQIIARQSALGGAELRRRQLHQDIASIDVLAFADVKRGDHAAVTMLHALTISRHDDRP